MPDTRCFHTPSEANMAYCTPLTRQRRIGAGLGYVVEGLSARRGPTVGDSRTKMGFHRLAV
ncbi:hypothetical protein NITHO_1140005 [Nitrolancea hollandica Lb]|uniref:Uncharacterized protein n=1 Tax=Nitrolancea hollandica Lb TaxID=1129897 RepID=I4ECN0_9BACT|nr:hypothetical protein NITHO_1140005 [Nitrolancea hollandica Lb]